MGARLKKYLQNFQLQVQSHRVQFVQAVPQQAVTLVGVEGVDLRGTGTGSKELPEMPSF